VGDSGPVLADQVPTRTADIIESGDDSRLQGRFIEIDQSVFLVGHWWVPKTSQGAQHGPAVPLKFNET
jgi:hypothetical protein